MSYSLLSLFGPFIDGGSPVIFVQFLISAKLLSAAVRGPWTGLTVPGLRPQRFWAAQGDEPSRMGQSLPAQSTAKVEHSDCGRVAGASLGSAWEGGWRVTKLRRAKYCRRAAIDENPNKEIRE